MADITYQNVLLLDDNENGLIPYIPPATADSLGVIKAGHGMSIDDDGMANVSTRNIGELVVSFVPLVDAAVHLLDGSIIVRGAYRNFIDYMANLYGDGTNVPSYFCTESEWQQSVATYGVCGKFVYDSTNNTVRLPKCGNKIYTQKLSTTAPVKGNGMVVGLTDGTINAGLYANSSGYVGGFLAGDRDAFGENIGTSGISSSLETNKSVGITTDGSKSGIIADIANITTSLEGYYYITIATSTKSPVEVDINQIMTDLTSKADTSLANVTDSAKITMSEAGMPSDKFIDLTIGVSGSTYTAPANGWVCLWVFCYATSGWFNLQNENSSFLMNIPYVAKDGGVGGYLPIKKGERFNVNYGHLSFEKAGMGLKFYYAQGSESEAN